MIKSATVRPMNRTDYDAASFFLEKITARVYKKALWIDRFESWWERNPAMRDTIPRGWVICSDNDEVEGFLANIPVMYYINGKQKLTCFASSWYVADEYRQKSLELLVGFQKTQNAAFLLDTTPTIKVAEILRRLGFKKLEREWLESEWIYPISVREFLYFTAHKMVEKRRAFFVMNILGGLVTPVIQILQLLLRLRVVSIKNKYIVREVQEFDDRYDTFWHAFKQKHLMMAERNKSALNWFYFSSEELSKSRKVFEINYIGNLIGYIAVKEVVHKQYERDFFSWEIVDIALLDDSASVYSALFSALVKSARNSNKKIMFIKAYDIDGKIGISLLNRVFMKRTVQSRIMYKYLDKDLPDEKVCSDFYATPLDGDRPFFP